MRIRLLATCLATGLAASPTVGEAPAPGAPTWLRAHDAEILQEYLEFLAIPNVVADPEGLRRTAAAIVARLDELGLAPRLLEGTSPDTVPAVFGEWRVPGATRTLVFYAHYDGQPVGDPSRWTATTPFAPRMLLNGQAVEVSLKDGLASGPHDDARIYARSSSDDKLGVSAFLTAVEALRATGGSPGVNAKFFFEGEEEAGSPHLREILERHRDLLASDGWVIVRRSVASHGTAAGGLRRARRRQRRRHAVRPAASIAQRALWKLGAESRAEDLARLLTSMKDRSGRVVVAGWYDDVEPLGEAERRAIDAAPRFPMMPWPPNSESRRRAASACSIESSCPSLNINGIQSGDVGAQARNVIPTDATAVLDLRLVKGNDWRRQFEKLVAHVRAQGYTVLDHPASPKNAGPTRAS